MSSASVLSISGSVATQLAAFTQDTDWNSLPERVQREAVRGFVNWVGCAVGGTRTASTEATIQALSALSGRGNTPVLGRTERLNAGDAALTNCLASAADTFDDTHLSTITHPTGPVAAALLAVAAERRVTGEAFLHALMIGMEIECRLSACITDPSSGANQGWYITGVTGGIGAAAAVSLLLGASADQTAIAMCLAATQSTGLRASHGGMSVAFVPAVAARNGITSAYFAKAGFTSGDHVIEGKNGLLPVLAPHADTSAILSQLGEHYEVLGNAYKPYPCGIVIHPTVDACLDIAKRLDDDAHIVKVDIAVHADAIFLCWRKLPSTSFEAQVSLYHWAAAALVRKQAGLEEGTEAAVVDPRIRSLQTVMEANADASLQPGQARVSVHLSDGTVHKSHILHATGSLENPMSDDELSEKFRLLARQRLSEAATERLLEACWSVQSSDDVGEIGRLGVIEQANTRIR